MRRRPKMDWDRVHAERHLYSREGKHIERVVREDLRAGDRTDWAGRPTDREGNFRWRSREWAEAHGWLTPKAKKTSKPRRGARECPDCGEWKVGLEQHRKDKHGDALTFEEVMEFLKREVGG